MRQNEMTFMEFDNEENSPIGLFALACERMNAFARSVRESSAFDSVRTGADIRYYESGWRLEKWVEAELDKTEGLWTAWWIELGPKEGGWIIESHLAVSPNVFFAPLEDRFAASPKELGQQLFAVVNDLEHALEHNKQFAEEVTKRRQKRASGQ